MIYQALKTVFSKPFYVVLASVVFFTTSTITLLWDNFSLLFGFSPIASRSESLHLALSLILGAPSNMGWLAVIVIVLTDILLGIVLAMVWYTWRHKRIHSWRTTAATTSGTIAAILGLGCIACGPLLLGSILAVFGASGILLLLPLHGAELSIFALGLLCYALYAIARVITAPAVCAVD